MFRKILLVVMTLIFLAMAEALVDAHSPPRINVSSIPDINLVDPVYRMVDKYAPEKDRATYKAAIDEAHLRYGVPRQMITAVIFRESTFNPRAKSKCHAIGPMQLTHYHWHGIDPWDIRDNILRGTQILSENYEDFGSWDRALSAYNAGPSITRCWIRKFGNNWKVALYTETRLYIPRVMSTYYELSVINPEYFITIGYNAGPHLIR
jgi:soluble lytic murein transglycosylase-like protein